MNNDEQAVFPISQLIDAKLHIKHAIEIINRDLISGGDGEISNTVMDYCSELVMELYGNVRRINNIIKRVEGQ